MGKAAFDRNSILKEMEENRENVREMVMGSYRDMQAGQGRDYKEFFAEIEGRYNNVLYNSRETNPFCS